MWLVGLYVPFAFVIIFVAPVSAGERVFSGILMFAAMMIHFKLANGKRKK